MAAALVLECMLGAPALAAQSAGSPRHTMAVTDIIEMTTFGSQPQGYLPSDIDVPSPDGRLHAVVVKRGNVAWNTNTFSLLVFRTGELFSEPSVDTVLTLTSSSNRPAISAVAWLDDSRTLALLGEHPAELPQVYTVDLLTRALSARTHWPREITGYNIAPSDRVIVYAARPPVDTTGYAVMRQRGFAVRATQFVGDIVKGIWADAASEWFSVTPPQLLILHAGATAPMVVKVPNATYRSCEPKRISVAPSGHVALIQCQRERAPAVWNSYTEPFLAKVIAHGYVPPEFAVLDLEHGTVAPLVVAPALGASFRWAPRGESVVLANAFLPLDDADSAERRTRAERRGIAEISVSTHRVTVIAHRDSLDVVSWDSAANTVDFIPGTYGQGPLDGPHVRYRKTVRGWIEMPGGRASNQLVLIVEQGLNLPPRLVAVDREAKRRAVVLDPNPQLATLALGREEIVHWRTKTGEAWVGGLYLPPDFVPSRRYPLVIQTHGFDSTGFRPDGSFPTANAAQPMAAHGILVLQIGNAHDGTWVTDFMTPREAPSNMEEIEAAIDHLDSLGLVDRSRVGLIGFSRSCFHVLYALTHSRYPIAAAAVTDGVDFGYLQYMLFQNARVGAGYTLDEFTAVNSGPPFGNVLDTWRERAPGFNLDRVTTPLRIEALQLPDVLWEWEPYAGLLVQHKPVELFVIPEGDHLLIKPWERLVSSEGNADWFRFWLKGEEDPNPAKAEQYARWRELRKLQRKQTARDSASVWK